MAVDPESLRVAMRQWATGVTVVTTEFEGVRHGMTVNSFVSVSLEPPLVLVSLEKTTRTNQLVKNSGVFGITILASHQQAISDCFAGRQTEGSDRFSNVKTKTLLTGASFIEEGLAFFDCIVAARYEAATHTLFIGEVVALEVAPEGEPLLYFKQHYRQLSR